VVFGRYIADNPVRAGMLPHYALHALGHARDERHVRTTREEFPDQG
jgi:hypothetical protein